MSKKKNYVKNKKSKKEKVPYRNNMMIGTRTKCRFCAKVVELQNAWNCCYADKYKTVANFRNGTMVVEEIDQQVDVQEAEDGGEPSN